MTKDMIFSTGPGAAKRSGRVVWERGNVSKLRGTRRESDA
jgi:hypothetical protein